VTDAETDIRPTATELADPDDMGTCGLEPWLTDREQRVWRNWLALSRMMNDRIERDMQQHGGMPLAYYLVLAMLSEAPEQQLRMNRLSEMVGFSQSRLSHAVARLEALGWVNREQAEGDRRGQIASLTEAGFQRLETVAPLHADTVRSLLFDPLDDDQLSALEAAFDAILRAESGYQERLRVIDPQR
jgi:DNA-binding MarR family transcriptional regulator